MINVKITKVTQNTLDPKLCLYFNLKDVCNYLLICFFNLKIFLDMSTLYWTNKLRSNYAWHVLIFCLKIAFLSNKNVSTINIGDSMALRLTQAHTSFPGPDLLCFYFLIIGRVGRINTWSFEYLHWLLQIGDRRKLYRIVASVAWVVPWPPRI